MENRDYDPTFMRIFVGLVVLYIVAIVSLVWKICYA